MKATLRGSMGSALLVLGQWLVGPALAAEAPRRPEPAPATRTPPACTPSRSPAVAGVPGFYRDCDDAPAMIALRGGDFRMGDLLGNGHDYERPAHTVHVAPFSIGRYEVTVADWSACVKAGACAAVPGAAASDHPVTHVSWEQARQYTSWLSERTGRRYRLPTEAEWEYAARAGSSQQFTWGNFDEMACPHANTFDQTGRSSFPSWNWSVPCDDGAAQTAAVGSYPPNAWGLHDVVGNVWEWVADCWHGSYDGAPQDSTAWVEDGCSKRVNRGGGWGNHPRSARLSNRDGDNAAARSDGLGFRVARDAR